MVLDSVDDHGGWNEAEPVLCGFQAEVVADRTS